MRLSKARVQKYRSIRDSGWFDVDANKSILVGVNEAGKSVLFQAIQQINPPNDVKKFDVLRDYPRSEYNDIDTKKVDPNTVTVVEAHFTIDDEERKNVPDDYKNCIYVYGRKYDNTGWHNLINAPQQISKTEIKNDISRLIKHVIEFNSESAEAKKNCDNITNVVEGFKYSVVYADDAISLMKSLEIISPYIDEDNEKEIARYAGIIAKCEKSIERDKVIKYLNKRLPIFVLFNNYFRVRPNIHLASLAARITNNTLDDNRYDYGNICLLKLLGFSAKELSDLGNAQLSDANSEEQMEQYRAQMDKRFFKLNSASHRLTQEIREIWNPDTTRGEADSIRVSADGQYLRVTVTDDIGVDIELDQRSEGFQWLVSFFVVFFAEAEDRYENAILLLDEPGLSLHGLKQREFRQTLSKLSCKNQLLYTTHSPFLVGPDELELVRVVEMTDRTSGTKVHTNISTGSPTSLLPLQEALGYDLASSLFSQQRNLVLEGITDLWYLESISNIMKESKHSGIHDNIALIPAGSASKVVYYATILHAHKLKVAALLDSDSAGDQAAKQDTLIGSLRNKSILRTKDVYKGKVTKCEFEDLLRNTLVNVAKDHLSIDVEEIAKKQESRPIIDIFEKESGEIAFSKYSLAKSFNKWAKEHSFVDLFDEEKEAVADLCAKINKALK